jgi:homoserine kinase
MMRNKSVTAFAPATVANVGCGFDIMGFAVKGIGDKVTITLENDKAETHITMSGYYASLIPTEWHKNTAGVAVKAYLEATGKTDVRPSISLEKNLPLGSGLGSSASSAAAAVFALNRLLGNLLTTTELIPFAMEGERIACGTAHADNVAPSLLGGFVLIRSYKPLDIIQIKCPDELFCTIVHPHIQVKTSDARRILKHDIPMPDVIRQSANTAAFMTGLIKEDFDLMGRSICDLLAEPKRTQLIPGFEQAKRAALNAGAIGCGISGSGPSVFALCKGELISRQVAEVMRKTFSEAELASDTYISPMNAPGACIV